VLVARFADRIGKGIRGAPRDALIADVTPPAVRGAAYGLRQALDSAGALVGPLLAAGLMRLMEDGSEQVRTVFWIAVLPAVVAVVLLAIGVQEPSRHAERPAQSNLPRWHELPRIGRRFWAVVAMGTLVALARFSEAFLVLRSYDAGLSFAATPLALVVMNATYVASAYPAGWLSDRIDRIGLLMIGLVVLIVADFMLAWGVGIGVVLGGVALWGLHMGLTQGLFAAMVADAAPTGLRGTAFGIFNLIGGVVAVLASLIAGSLWKLQGPSSTFLAGAAFAAAGLVVLLWSRRR
jgi:MFS family permease